MSQKRQVNCLKKSVSLIISLQKQMERWALMLGGNGEEVACLQTPPAMWLLLGFFCLGGFLNKSRKRCSHNITWAFSLLSPLLGWSLGDHQMGRKLSSPLLLSYPFNTFWCPEGFSQVLILLQWFSKLFELWSGREQYSLHNSHRNSPCLPKNAGKKPKYYYQRTE